MKVYIERASITPMVALTVAVCAAIAVAFGWMSADPKVHGGEIGVRAGLTAVAVLFAVVGATLAVRAGRRPEVLRADRDGITLGRPPVLFSHHGPWSRTPPAVFVPWSDIAGVETWANSGEGPHYLGIRLRRGATPPPEEPSHLFGRRPDGVVLQRQIYGWRLDLDRLRKLTPR